MQVIVSGIGTVERAVVEAQKGGTFRLLVEGTDMQVVEAAGWWLEGRWRAVGQMALLPSILCPGAAEPVPASLRLSLIHNTCVYVTHRVRVRLRVCVCPRR